MRRTGDRRWLARCPAHDDRGPSLSIRELDDGRILVHCFSGCAVHDIVSAVGLELHDLFPPRPLDHRVPRERTPFPAADVLRAVAFEGLVLTIMAEDIARGETPTTEARQRAALAAKRLMAAVDLALPLPDRRAQILEGRRIAEQDLADWDTSIDVSDLEVAL